MDVNKEIKKGSVKMEKKEAKIWDIEKELLDSFENNSEKALLRILKDNSFLFYCLFSRKVGALPIFREVELGSKLRCDFTWLNDNSNGPEWILVEVEKPRMRLFNADRTPTAELNAAIEQVKSWQRYFANNPGEKKNIFGAVANFRYILVAGDKETWSEEEAMKWRSHHNQTTDFEIRSSDVFLRAIKELKQNPDDFWSFEENPTTKPFKELQEFWKGYGYMDRMRKIFN